MKKDEEKLWDAFFACGLYLYLEKTGELDKEKLWHETPEETERHWQQFRHQQMRQLQAVLIFTVD